MKETTARLHMNPYVVVIKHNARVYEVVKFEKHIDLTATHEVWVDGTLIESYTEVFGDALEEYNNKQKRKDRKINGIEEYMKSVEEDKRGRKQRKKVNGKLVVVDDPEREGKRICYEIILGTGNTNMEKDENGHFVYRDDAHEYHYMRLPYEVNYAAAKAYCDTWYDRNETADGGMKIVRIDWHADEFYINKITGLKEMSTEHAHEVFFPWARGYKQGLSVQQSMNKALKALGFEDGEEVDENGKKVWKCAYTKWLEREREVYEKCIEKAYYDYCKQHPDYYKENGELKIVHPYVDKNAVNLPTETYREIQDSKKTLDNVQLQVEEEKENLAHKKDVVQSFDNYLQSKKQELSDLEGREQKVNTDSEQNRQDRVDLMVQKIDLKVQQDNIQKMADDTAQEYQKARADRVKAEELKKCMEQAKKDAEQAKNDAESYKKNLEEKYAELLKYVQEVQQTAQQKQQELEDSLDYIKNGDTEDVETEIDKVARELRKNTTVTYKGKSYNVESIYQGSVAEATKIVYGKRDTKKADVRAKVTEFIADTEEMLQKYDDVNEITK